jgi:tetratricopeptide (TPR) repeat protein
MPVEHTQVTEGASAQAGALRGRNVGLLVAAILATGALILGARTNRSDAGQTAAAAVAPPSEASGFAAAMQATESGSPAERRIAAARAALEKNPKRASLWNDLALGLARRARETAETALYGEAWSATERSLQVEPGNLEGRKLQVWILLGQHEFQRAVDMAEQINRSVPDDVLVYGFLVDGYTELGRYAEAEKAAQWMLDLRPGNVPGLTRAAYLRELFGDHEGAVELMDSAYRRTAHAEFEDRAWILTQIAHLSLLTCRTAAAEALLDEALKLFPDYHYALAQMAELRVAQGRLQEAATLRARHVEVAPHPENRYELGVALARAGKVAEAQIEWQAFETAARAEMSGWDNANVELIYYYVDHAGRPAEALTIARREVARRRDVRTLEAFAWALQANGLAREAKKPMDKALAVGIRTAASFYHAGAIAEAAGDAAAARKYWEQSLATCGTSAVSQSARARLQATTASSPSSGGR